MNQSLTDQLEDTPPRTEKQFYREEVRTSFEGQNTLGSVRDSLELSRELTTEEIDESAYSVYVGATTKNGADVKNLHVLLKIPEPSDDGTPSRAEGYLLNEDSSKWRIEGDLNPAS